MKKFLSVISAMAICTSCFSCSKKNDDKSPQHSFAVETMGNVAYKTDRLTLPDGLSMIYCLEPFAGCSQYLIVGAADSGVGFWVTDSSFSSFNKIDIEDFKSGESYMLDAVDDGTLVTFVKDVSYGDLPDPDYSSPDYNYEKYQEAAEYKFRIIAYSSEGKVISDNDVKDFPVMPEQMTQITECVSDGKIVIVTIDGSTEVFSIDGTYIGELKAKDGETIENFGKNSSGELIAAVRTSDKNIQLRQIGEKGELKASSIDYELSETVNGEIQPGWGDYTMFLRSMTTIYGIRSGDNSIVPLFSVNRAGLNSSNFSNFAMCPDGNFAVPVTNYSNWSCQFKKFIPCDPSELENIPILTIGVDGNNYPLRDYLELFNDDNEAYHIELRQYGGNGEDYSVITEMIQKDALSGDLPDIMSLNGISGSIGDFDTLQNDIYCDLYEFMDKDDTLTRDALVPNFLEYLDYNFDGHLYLMPESFDVNLYYAVKTEFAKDIENWDINTYFDLLESPPAGIVKDSDTPEENQWERLNIDFSDYIDYKNASCSIDCPEVIRGLKYAYEGVPLDEFIYSSENEEYDEDAQDAQQRRYYFGIRENRDLFTNGYIANYGCYLDLKQAVFGGEPFTVLGKPKAKSGAPVISVNGSSFGIVKTSQNKELAWDFIKHILSDDYLNDYILTESYGWGVYFHPTKSGMELVAEYEKKPQKHKYAPNVSDYGGMINNTWTKDEDGNYIYEKIGFVDDALIAEVNDIIAAADPHNNAVSNNLTSEQNGEINFILNEELDRFFHGEISAEDCAYTLDNRISIYLSEQFG